MNSIQKNDGMFLAKILLARMLYPNTPNAYLKALLECYMEFLEAAQSGKRLKLSSDEEKALQILDKVLSFIVDDGYRMEHFGLFEIPIEGTYCFVSKNGKRCFDIYAYDGQISAGYICNTNEKQAVNISTAVSRYEVV